MKQFAVVDLPEEKFPFTVEAFGPDGDVVWEETVERPVSNDVRRPLRVPGLGEGSVVRVRVSFADGTVDDSLDP